MKTEQLIEFNFTNGPITRYVKATEFVRTGSDKKEWRVVVISAEEEAILYPSSRAEAMERAEQYVGEFLKQMYPIYVKN